MNAKPKIPVDADALKQVLAALVGPGHLIRELQAIRGLPVLGGVVHDPIGALITQFNDFENRDIAAEQQSEPQSTEALQAMIEAKDSLAEVLASTGDALIGLHDRAKEGDSHSDDTHDRASAAISALDGSIVGGLGLSSVFALAMKDSWQLVDPLRPAGQPGSYARGHYQGIADALRTVQANFLRHIDLRAAQGKPPSIAEAAEDQSDREIASMRLSDLASGADSLVTGVALDQRLEALHSEDSAWYDVERDPPLDRIRVILASDDFVYGDCFFGWGSVQAGKANNPDYVAERAKSTWRYSSNEDALPPHFTPTKWQPLPDAPNKSIPRAGVKRVPKKLSP